LASIPVLSVFYNLNTAITYKELIFFVKAVKLAYFIYGIKFVLVCEKWV